MTTSACQTTGDLTILVQGLPSGASGAASVFTSGGTLVGSLPPGSNPTTFNSLAAGTYSIHAFSVTFGGQTYNPTAATLSATVTVGGNTNVIITYQAAVPTAATQAASSITATSLQMNGLINPNGVSAQAWFEWGTSSSLSTFSLTTAANMGSGTSNVALTSNLTGLTCGTTYYYRAVAGPAVGSVVRGSILSTTTSACQTATGDLTVLVQGLPSGASGAASVFTSGGTLVGSLSTGSNLTTFNNLPVGTYTIHVFAVTFGGQTYNPTVTSLSAIVTSGSNTNVIITYH